MFQRFQIDFQRNCALGKIRSTKIDEFILYLYTRKIVYISKYQLVLAELSNCHGHASLCKKPIFDSPLGSMAPSSIQPSHSKELSPSLF
jgi:hypothetical protein